MKNLPKADSFDDGYDMLDIYVLQSRLAKQAFQAVIKLIPVLKIKLTLLLVAIPPRKAGISSLPIDEENTEVIIRDFTVAIPPRKAGISRS